ncbi:MAG: ASCH domain-containing protein [Myxococcales bacterium]|nr:ASCH domain-containing protein [Myxococcales bacterium]
MSDPIYGLTIHHPWAHLVATGDKTIEARTWPTKHRGWLAIHAATAGSIQWAPLARLQAIGLLEDADARLRETGGHVVAIAQLVDCQPWRPESHLRHAVSHTLDVDQCGAVASTFRDARWAWRLGDVVPIAPIPWRGRQSLWLITNPNDLQLLRSAYRDARPELRGAA